MKNIYSILIFFFFSAAAYPYNTANAVDSMATDTISRDMSLEEVLVKTDRIIRNPKGYTVNLLGSDIVKGKDMEQLLAMLPEMTVEDGSIKIQGVIPSAIYIDGVRVTDMDMLKNIPPGHIAKIEVDRYPGREESADAKGGVIRIKMKKENGVAGTLVGSSDMLPHYGYTGEAVSSFLSFGTKRMTLYNSSVFSHRKRIGDYEETRDFKSGDESPSHIDEKTWGWSRLFYDWMNLSYDIATGHELGISGFVMYCDDKASIDATTTEDGDNLPVMTRYKNPSNMLTLQAVALYNWDIDSLGSTFKVTADYLRRDFNQKFKTGQVASGAVDAYDVSVSKQATDMLRVSPILNMVMHNKDELTAGVDVKYVHLRDRTSGSYETSRSLMTGFTPAAFVSYAGSIGEKTSYDVGIRFQHDRMDVKFEDVKNKYRKWNVCPSANITYAFNREKGRFASLQYEHYVDELPYDAVSTFRKYDATDHYTVGNPGIKPASGDNVKLTFGLSSRFSVYAGLDYYKDAIYYTNDTDPDDSGVLRSMARNGMHELTMSIGMEQRLNPAKWWSLKAVERVSVYSGKTPDWDVSGQTHWFFMLNNDFRFTKTFGGGLNGYVDPEFETQDMVWKTVIDVNLNVYKTFFDERLMLKLDVKPYRKGRETKTENALYRSVRKNVTKEEYFMFTVRYTFRKGKIKSRKAAESTQEYNTISRSKG